MRIISILSTFAALSGFGILLSNVFAGFVVVYTSENKEEYIMIGGVSRIISSFIMLV